MKYNYKDLMKRSIKYLKPSYYEVGENHKEEYAKLDIASVSHICYIIAFIYIMALFTILIFPNVARFDTGLDNLPIAIASIAFSVLGIVTADYVTNVNIVTKSKFLRAYIYVYFIALSVYELLFGGSEIVALVVYIVYCFAISMIVRVNPMLYIVQLCFYIIITLESYTKYFNSVTVVFTYFSILVCNIFLIFYQNHRYRRFIKHYDEVVAKEQSLSSALQQKQDEIVAAVCNQVKIQENIVYAIANLVESRDADTGTHIKATAYYTHIITNYLVEHKIYADELNTEFADIIEKAAPMHDLGKIVIPDSILKVPRRLTDEEFSIMKTHTTEGAKIVKQLFENIETQQYIDCATNIAECHHERWDGNGYPKGLKGEEIPIEARIMAVADVFDALISRRCYKDAYPISQAFDTIKQGSGTQFDSVIVDAFLANKDIVEGIIIDNFSGFDDIQLIKVEAGLQI